MDLSLTVSSKMIALLTTFSKVPEHPETLS